MDLKFGVDGYPVLYSHQEFLGDMIVRYLENEAEELCVIPRYVGKEYAGININLKSRLKGWYILYSRHPITGKTIINVGSTFDGIRKRVSAKIGHVLRGEGKEVAFAREWVSQVGNNVDYCYVKYVPLDRAEFNQDLLRGVEGYLVKWYRNKYGKESVINIEENPTATLNTQIVVTTPALEGI